ncbi:MAG TPA: hypothetical protein VGG29_20845 [Caulobacteraceae bacterium]|jgi:hypothetical protein
MIRERRFFWGTPFSEWLTSNWWRDWAKPGEQHQVRSFGRLGWGFFFCHVFIGVVSLKHAGIYCLTKREDQLFPARGRRPVFDLETIFNDDDEF